jgi:hypothetical protein
MDTPQPFSLLWPTGASRCHTELDAQCVRDLELDQTLLALTRSSIERGKVRDILTRICTDPAVIAYRQDIIEGLWDHPAFREGLEALLPSIGALESYRSSFDRKRSTFQDVTWRLGELDHFVTCVSGLNDLFDAVGDGVQAEGWRTLRGFIAQTAGDPVYRNLTRELPGMLDTLRTKASVTIGVNLDSQLRPVAATLLSVNARRFTSSSFIDRLLGREGDDFKGIGPLHSVPEIDSGPGIPGLAGGRQDVNPLMVPLFSDLARVLDSVCRPIARILRRYVTVQSGFLATLSGDMTFYMAAIRLMERLRNHGLPVCRPGIAPTDERVGELREAYNLNLALQGAGQTGGADRIVRNDVCMDRDRRITILTGPNQGGKTTYTQMVGLCQILAQAGLWLPAASARVSLVDNIFTHYPVEESLAKATGRFGDEAQRLSQIFKRATRHSLILLNESLSSTSPGESVYLAQDISRILRRMGTRAIFATHLHELAAAVPQLNAEADGAGGLVSLVASRLWDGEDGDQRSYKILPGPPMGRSYAREIASKYGISYEQLTTLLQERGVLDEPS